MPMSTIRNCLAAWVACATLNPGWAGAADIKIGVIAGMSGLGASYGLGIAQGAKMAAQDINDAGGIAGRKIEIVIADDASAPARSAVVMRRLVTSNVDLIVGGWGSPQVLANKDIAESAGIPYIVVGATHPEITSAKNKWTFRVIQSDALMAEQLAKIATETFGARRIAVIADSNAYGIGNRDIFVTSLGRGGVKPVAIQSYQTDDADFTAQLGHIHAARPDAIAIFGTVPAAPKIMNQARALGITARFLGTGGLASEALLSLAPGAAEGAVLTTYFNEEMDPEAKAWADSYRQQFDDLLEPPRPILAAWEYRAIRSIVAPCLMSIAGPDRVLLRDCIANWRGRLFGVPDEVYFDKTGQLVQPPLIVEVRARSFQLLKPGKPNG